MIEVSLIIWMCLTVLTILGCIMYAGYKGDELDYQGEKDLEGLCATVGLLPILLLILVAASPLLSIWGIGKLIRLGVDKYGRSKKNRA